MRCPKCGVARENYVKDTRSAFDDGAIRRRRVCRQCDFVFTTYEVSDTDFRAMRELTRFQESLFVIYHMMEAYFDHGSGRGLIKRTVERAMLEALRRG